jgi:hypothetical protein
VLGILEVNAREGGNDQLSPPSDTIPSGSYGECTYSKNGQTIYEPGIIVDDDAFRIFGFLEDCNEMRNS